jgi:uncharacterized 2Fe-2S/4Fe-4S cluster protein (DUF4445 family)
MADKKSFHIEFQPLGLRNRCPVGESLLECARRSGIDLVSLCGGKGTCGKCKVQIVSGDVSEPLQKEKATLSAEEISRGYRLACQTYPEGDLVLNVPAESLSAPQRLQVEGVELPVSLDPVIQTYDVSLPIPSLSDIRGDDERLFETLEKQHGVVCKGIDEAVSRSLSSVLRSLKWKVSATVRDAEVIALGPWGRRRLGMAVDLGTTKIAGYLVDLETGMTLSAQGIMNPQISYGEDVIARIVRALHFLESFAKKQPIPGLKILRRSSWWGIRPCTTSCCTFQWSNWPERLTFRQSVMPWISRRGLLGFLLLLVRMSICCPILPDLSEVITWPCCWQLRPGKLRARSWR